VAFSFSAPDVGAIEYTGTLTGGLEALWNFEDNGSGQALGTDSEGDYDVTNTNTVPTSATHKQGSHSADLTAANDEYFTRTGAAGDFNWNSTNECTMCSWMNLDTTPGEGALYNIFTKGTVAGEDFEFSSGVNEEMELVIYVGIDGTDYSEYTFADDSASFVEDQWYFVCIAINDSGSTSAGLADREMRIRIWDDTAGAVLSADETPLIPTSVGSVETPHWGPGQGGDINIGCYTEGSYQFDGLLDGFRFYSKALTADEMDAIRDAPLSAFTLAHCDSSGDPVEAETTYTTGQYGYLSLSSNGGAIYRESGSLEDLKIALNVSNLYAYYLSGIESSKLIFRYYVPARVESSDLQAAGTDEETGLMHGDLILLVGAVEPTYDLADADPSGGNIILDGTGRELLRYGEIDPFF